MMPPSIVNNREPLPSSPQPARILEERRPTREGLYLISALGQNPNASRRLARQLSPAADKPPHGLYSAMCQEPTHAPQQNVSLFDYLVGTREQRGRHGEAKRLRCLEVDHKLLLGRRLHRQVKRLEQMNLWR
jgi:hypothetical protein